MQVLLWPLSVVVFAVGSYFAGKRDGRRNGYDDGFNAGLVQGSKDTPFHVGRVRADACGSIELAREVAADCIEEMRAEILNELEECARRYNDKEQANHGA